MIKKVKLSNRLLGVLAALCMCLSLPAAAQSPSEKGRQIMEKIDSLPTLEKMLSETILHIYDAEGKKIFSKKSRTANFKHNFRDKDKRLSRSINYFYAPADDKGNGALMIEVKDVDDEQWIYLKGLRKPKKVLGSDKSSSFMGSDFSNGDIAARDIDDYNYTWLGTEKASTVYQSRRKKKKITLSVEKIESSFKEKSKRDDYGYSKSIVWVNAKTGLPLKMEYYNLSGQLSKKGRLVTFAIRKNKDGKKVYIPSSLEMQNVIKGTKTIMQTKTIKTGKAASKIKPGIFKVSYLQRKWW